MFQIVSVKRTRLCNPIVTLNQFIRLYSGKSAKSSSQNKWLNRQKGDRYTKEAKAQDFRSRAAFKLIEINEKFKLFDMLKKQNILDLGFAPGAWSQVARLNSNSESVVLGVDILPCQPPRGVDSIQANILSKKTQEYIRWFFNARFNLNRVDGLDEQKGFLTRKYTDLDSNDETINKLQYPIDVIISDMYEPWFEETGYWSNLTNMPHYRMANTTGIRVKDHQQSIDLCDAALVTAIDLLKPKGNFVCKIYTGENDLNFEKRMRKVFNKVTRFKPDASRQESKETYFLGLEKKSDINKLDVFTT